MNHAQSEDGAVYDGSLYGSNGEIGKSGMTVKGWGIRQSQLGYTNGVVDPSTLIAAQSDQPMYDEQCIHHQLSRYYYPVYSTEDFAVDSLTWGDAYTACQRGNQTADEAFDEFQRLHGQPNPPGALQDPVSGHWSWGFTPTVQQPVRHRAAYFAKKGLPNTPLVGLFPQSNSGNLQQILAAPAQYYQQQGLPVPQMEPQALPPAPQGYPQLPAPSAPTGVVPYGMFGAPLPAPEQPQLMPAAPVNPGFRFPPQLLMG